MAVKMDVAKEAEVEAAVKAAVETFGRLDIMCELAFLSILVWCDILNLYTQSTTSVHALLLLRLS